MLKTLRQIHRVGIATEPRPDSDDTLRVRDALQSRIRGIMGRALCIRQVDAGSCNGCEMEIVGLSSPVYDLERFGIHFVASPRHADLLLVTGPVTRNMELALRKTYYATQMGVDEFYKHDKEAIHFNVPVKIKTYDWKTDEIQEIWRGDFDTDTDLYSNGYPHIHSHLHSDSFGSAVPTHQRGVLRYSRHGLGRRVDRTLQSDQPAGRYLAVEHRRAGPPGNRSLPTPS